MAKKAKSQNSDTAKEIRKNLSKLKRKGILSKGFTVRGREVLNKDGSVKKSINDILGDFHQVITGEVKTRRVKSSTAQAQLKAQGRTVKNGVVIFTPFEKLTLTKRGKSAVRIEPRPIEGMGRRYRVSLEGNLLANARRAAAHLKGTPFRFQVAAFGLGGASNLYFTSADDFAAYFEERYSARDEYGDADAFFDAVYLVSTKDYLGGKSKRNTYTRKRESERYTDDNGKRESFLKRKRANQKRYRLINKGKAK